ncbi:alpha/beta hydrolase [Kineococcus sp. SYSU DK004]|uniref:alpha/beta hydrolase n=1 Tax=Kineococcus sp. SYSU DK004 TaxID=3383125 RepID=UPI003D7DFEAB
MSTTAPGPRATDRLEVVHPRGELRPDPRLSDPDAARLVAEHARRTAGWTPRHLAGVATARARDRRGGPGPVDDEHVLVADLHVRGAAGPLRARRYVPRTALAGAGTVVHLHGGWVTGDLDTDDALCRVLAARTGAVVLSPCYRHAPEHPFPGGLRDAAAVLGLVADGAVPGVPTGPLAVSGTSTGGTLAAALARWGRDGAAPPLAAQLLLSPVLDHRLDRDSHERFGDGLLLTREDLAWSWDLYLPDRRRRADPDASPLRVPDPAGLPPAVLVVSGADPVRDEGVEHAERLRAAGVPVELLLREGVPHAHVALPGLPAGERDLAAAADALRALLARRTAPATR